jgi:hypothetical protein
LLPGRDGGVCRPLIQINAKPRPRISK